jgi:predicted small secreted protein
MKILMLLAVLTAVSGCATVEGVGRDISGGARKVNDWLG